MANVNHYVILMLCLYFLILMTRFCLFGTQLKVFGTLKAQLLLGLACFTFQPQHYLTGSLGLFMKDRFSLSTKSHLLGIITTFTLSKVGCLSSLVLRHLVKLMLSALAAGTKCLALFWNIHHDNNTLSSGIILYKAEREGNSGLSTRKRDGAGV